MLAKPITEELKPFGPLFLPMAFGPEAAEPVAAATATAIGTVETTPAPFALNFGEDAFVFNPALASSGETHSAPGSPSSTGAEAVGNSTPDLDVDIDVLIFDNEAAGGRAASGAEAVAPGPWIPTLPVTNSLPTLSEAAGDTVSAMTPSFDFSNVGPPAGRGPGGGGGGGDNTLYATYTSGADDGPDMDGTFIDNFNIKVEFYGTWGTAYMDAFAAAADFLSSIMLSGLRDDPESYNSFDTGTVFTVDDVLIEARLPEIDGIDNVLGRAAAYSVREPGSEDEYTTVVGVMEFDSADAAGLLGDGTWDDVILHEMIHTLGFGSLWDNYYPDILTIEETTEWFEGEFTKRPTDDVFETTSTAVYNGVEGNAEYNAENGTSDAKIDVETDGASGTALAHWDEDIYGSELMTGYLGGTGDSVYLADWSLAALADIGYDVDLEQFARAESKNTLAVGIDLEIVDPLLAFYDAAGVEFV